ncbi:MAG: hypothetical protein U9R53_11540 [Chloroflexota bacterium]|nr:hypothetical protein [Chloroflexota bacterium]
MKETMERAKSGKVIITIAKKEKDEETHLITVSSEGVLVSMNRELKIVIPAGDNDQNIETAIEEVPLKNLLDIIEESEEGDLIVTVKKE